MRKVYLGLIGSLLLWGMMGNQAIYGQEFEPQWYHQTVWYEIFVRSFYDSDGDGIGDLQGVIQKLDYLNDGNPDTTDDLGITGIWLMPIMEAASPHGYDTTNYLQVDPDYGSNEDFLALVEAAHARGIRVIVDLVLNHTSDQHPWFQASRAGDPSYTNWYIWETENPRYAGPWGQNVWYRDSLREEFYYAVFWGRMPDLNHENSAVQQEIREATRFWVEDMGVDGFRLDAIRYLKEIEVDGRPILADSPDNRIYLAEINDYAHTLNPDLFTVGEVLLRTPNTIARYTNENAVDSAFDFALAEDVVTAISLGNKREIQNQLFTTLRTYEAGDFATLTTNHDFDRLLSQLGEDQAKNRAVLNLHLTLPGIPFLYYGEEIGMRGVRGAGAEADAAIRRPMQWEPIAETAGFTTGRPWRALDTNIEEATVATQTDDPDSLLSYYRNLIHLRNAHPALQYGETIALESTYKGVWGYLRYTEGETLLVLLNVDDKESRDYLLSIEESDLRDAIEADVVFSTNPVIVHAPQVNADGGFSEYVPVEGTLPPFSMVIIQLRS